jgi:hypothetical protein
MAMGGNNSARPRAAVDLAVPFSPLINTPPIRGLMALRTRANFNRSCPTRAAKGYTGRLGLMGKYYRLFKSMARTDGFLIRINYWTEMALP